MKVEWDGKGRLSKKRALFLCWQLYLWVASEEARPHWERVNFTPAVKNAWPEWKHNGGNVELMEGRCPLCEECHNDYDITCDSCLLIDLWRGTTGTGCKACEMRTSLSRKPPCENYTSSPYLNLMKAETWKEVQEHALTIADYAKKKYEELEVRHV